MAGHWPRQSFQAKDARITEAIERAKSLRAFRKVDVSEYTLESFEADGLIGKQTRQYLFREEDGDDYAEKAEEQNGEPEADGGKDLDANQITLDTTPPVDSTPFGHTTLPVDSTPPGDTNT
jgi:hypothetical protein